MPDRVPVGVPHRLIAEPHLLRSVAAAVLGMLLVAAVLGAVGGVVLFWLGTSMLQYLR